MKTLKHILILAIVMLIGTSTVAQSGDFTAEQKAQFEEQLASYLDELDLSEDQTEKFKEISRRYAGQMKSLKESDKSRLSKYKELKSIQKNKNEEMKTLLSEEQYQIYEKMQEEMKKKMKEKRKNKS